LAENAIAPFKAIFTAAKNFVGDRVSDVVDFFKALPGRLLNLLEGIASAAKNIGEGIFKGLIGAVKTLPDVLVALVKTAINAVIGLINQIKIPSFHVRIHGPGPLPDIVFDTPEIDPIPHIPELARGTRMFSGGLALVGEKGPELALLPRGTAVLPNDLLRGAGLSGLGGRTEIHVHGHVHADGFMVGEMRDLADRLATELAPRIPSVAMYRNVI
jgi:phage-related protein